MDFACVSRAETCQRIAKQRLLRNMKQGTFTCTFGPRAFAVQVGSLLTLSITAEGWNNKLFRVIDQAETVDLVFQMTLQEEDAAIYAWDNSETPLPANIKIPSYDPNAVVAVVGLNAASRELANNTGGNESYIDVTWTVPTPLVASIQIQTKEATGSVWQNATSGFDAQSGVFTFRAPAGGLSTDVRARYRMHSGAFGDWANDNVTAAETSAGTAASAITGYLTDESVTFAADASGTIL
jgi:hypothetical protein